MTSSSFNMQSFVYQQITMLLRTRIIYVKLAGEQFPHYGIDLEQYHCIFRFLKLFHNCVPQTSNCFIYSWVNVIMMICIIIFVVVVPVILVFVTVACCIRLSPKHSQSFIFLQKFFHTKLMSNVLKMAVKWVLWNCLRMFLSGMFSKYCTISLLCNFGLIWQVLLHFYCGA